MFELKFLFLKYIHHFSRHRNLNIYKPVTTIMKEKNFFFFNIFEYL